MKIVFYIVFITYLFLLFKRKSEFVFLLPLFNVIVDMSFFYFGGVSVATFYRVLVLGIFFYFTFKNYKITSPGIKILAAFLIYTFVLVLQSSEFIYSLKGYSQVFFSMSLFPIGYVLINTKTKFDVLNKEYVKIIILSVLVTAIGYIFGVGKGFAYSKELDAHTGLLGSAGLYSGAVCIAIFPSLLNSIQKKIWKNISLLFAIILYIFILLNVRRTAILIPIIGVFFYLVFSKEKKKMLFGIILSGLILLVTSSFYLNTLIERYKIREEQGRFEEDFYKTEKRYTEILDILDQIKTFNEPIKILTGLGNKIYAEHVTNNRIPFGARMYHSDIAKLIYGAGIIGLFLYLRFYVYLTRYLAVQNDKRDSILKQHKAVVFSIILINVLVMSNGSLNLITLKSTLFLYLGASLKMYMLRRKELLEFTIG